MLGIRREGRIWKSGGTVRRNEREEESGTGLKERRMTNCVEKGRCRRERSTGSDKAVVVNDIGS